MARCEPSTVDERQELGQKLTQKLRVTDIDSEKLTEKIKSKSESKSQAIEKDQHLATKLIAERVDVEQGLIECRRVKNDNFYAHYLPSLASNSHSSDSCHSSDISAKHCGSGTFLSRAGVALM